MDLITARGSCDTAMKSFDNFEDFCVEHEICASRNR